ncbi:sugar transporter ERD6-like 16 isoform X2 [Magnolia sinica]|uniref:sugar transporter ERD6-like 16 isoform X2 n=1 Tax=Magnolia sinica TaxID=86752 RepID=UPI00265A3443|nr:sugar transporter ERD6-like 16 isoform X2 [Magnolia sinica]
MAIHQDVETGGNISQDEITQPLIQSDKISAVQTHELSSDTSKGSLWVVLLSTFVAVCGSFEFGSCVGYSAPTQKGIRNDLGLSLAEYSVFGSILNIGAMIGAVTSGRIADLTGRKWAAWSLDLGRFSMGYGIGIVSYVVPVFIAEITPKNLRGGLTTVHQLMICSGVSVAFVVGVVVTWRTLALTGLVPCLILLLGLFFIPESPRWLAKVGREKEFKAALQRLRGKDADISKEAAEIQEYIETLEKLPKAGIQDLFQRRYALSVIVGVGLIAFQQFGGINGVAFYASEIFVSAGFSSGSVGTISIACVQVPITALGAILTDRTGRRPLLLIASTGTCLGNFLTAISFFLKDHGVLSGWAPMIALAGILIYIGSFSLGLGAVPWVIMSEIFPMNIKGIAGSLVTLMHWFGAWVVSYAFNFLMIWSSSGTFFLNAGVSAATVLFIAKLVPETKGRTLEEIQASMNS